MIDLIKLSAPAVLFLVNHPLAPFSDEEDLAPGRCARVTSWPPLTPPAPGQVVVVA